MCRNIRPLFNFDPPATEEEIYAASLQFVRKISGSTSPSKANEKLFHDAVEAISHQVQLLLSNMQTNSTPKNRDVEKEKARQQNLKRFAR